MSKYRSISLLLLAILLFLGLTGFQAEAQVELVENGSFETGDLTGWTLEETSPGGEWFVYSGTLSPLNSFTILPPPDGSFAAVTDQLAPNSTIIYQDFDIPTNSTVSCSAIVYYENRGQGFIIGEGLTTNTENQQYRVDIMNPNAPSFDTGAGVLLNLFQTLPGDPNSQGYTTINFDLSQFAGSTVRIRAGVVITQAALNGSIDTISCISGEAVRGQIPTLGEWGMIAMAGALGIVGLLAIRRRKMVA